MPDNDAFPETLVARLHAEAMRLAVSIASPASDDQMNALLGELFVVTTRLAQAPDRDANDLSLKLDVLCRRLREDVVPENPGDVLTYLLAEGIRDDVALRGFLTRGDNLRSDSDDIVRPVDQEPADGIHRR